MADLFESYKDYVNKITESDKNYTVEDVHVSTIRWGDTVLIDGVLKTVGKKDIKHGGFQGSTLCGDSYKSGRTPVKKVTFITKK